MNCCRRKLQRGKPEGEMHELANTENIWILVCPTFVFSSLLERAMMGAIGAKMEICEKKIVLATSKTISPTTKYVVQTSEKIILLDGCEEKAFLPLRIRRESSTGRIDRVSMVVFPGLFILFNIIY